MMHRMEVLSLMFLLAVGPLALLFGADSREDDPRGWWSGEGGRRPATGLRARPPARCGVSRAAASSAFRRANSLQPAGVLATAKPTTHRLPPVPPSRGGYWGVAVD